MAITYKSLSVPTPAGGGKRVVRGVLSFDNSYPTGGEVIDGTRFGLRTIEAFEIKGEELGYAFEYVPTTKKCKVYFGGSSAHDHATGTLVNDSVSGGTPAGTNNAPAFTGTPDTITPSLSADSAGTPAGTLDSISGGTPVGTLDSISGGTPAGTLDSISGGTPAGTNAQSDCMVGNEAFDMEGYNMPTFALVHSADPISLLNASTLNVGLGGPGDPIGHFVSVTNANASVSFTSAADGGIYATDQRARGWVKHVGAPSGVPVFVDEADGDKLKADFNFAGNPGDKLVGLQLSTGLMYLRILDANTVGMKLLYFDDNGADNAKLVYVDAGAVGGSIHDANKEKANYAGVLTDRKLGKALAQTFTGAALAGHIHTFSGVALAGHAHTFTGGALAGHAHTFSGSALGTHAHVVTGAAYTPAGSVDAPVFTGGALAGHLHTISGKTDGAAAGTAGEVANGTNLVSAGLTDCEFEAIGS